MIVITVLCSVVYHSCANEQLSQMVDQWPFRFGQSMGTLEPQSNGPLCSSTMIGTLVIDGWAVTFGTVRRGLGGLRPRPVPFSLYQM